MHVLVAFALLAASPSAQAAATLQVTPLRAAAAASVTVRGTGWRESGAACGPVRLRAYVEDVSPYPAVNVGARPVSAEGRFARAWRTPRVRERLVWTVRAEQRCGAARTVRYAKITIG